MAKLANTFVTTDANVNREELHDVVTRVSRDETPILSLIGSGSCKTTHPEWATNDLDSPVNTAQPEGNEYTFDALVPSDRLGNYTQILDKKWIVSNSQNMMHNAGDSEKGLKEQKLRKGIALRRNFELAVVEPNASVGGETRVSGGLPTWYETNALRGATGSNGGFNSGTGLTVAPGNGTQRAFTKQIMDDVLQACYIAGARVSHCVVSPYVKSVFATFMSDTNVAQFRTSANGGRNTIDANADVYQGPLGRVTVMPNFIMATSAATARNAHFIDPQMMDWKWYRKIKEDKDIAKTGDAQKKVLIGEGTLCVKNEKGLGVAADLFGLTATT